MEYHFLFYNVFGCPGLRRSSPYFILTLLLNLVYVALFPLTLFFAPMILMIKNYQGLLLVSDQAERLQNKTTRFMHLNLARVIVLIGFSLLGAIGGALISLFGSVVGSFYQIIKVLWILAKIIFCCESKLEGRETMQSPPPMLDVSDSVLSDGRSPGMNHLGGPRRLLCCIRLPNTCPSCFATAYKNDSDNKMNCLVCGAVWCWTCRDRIDESRQGELHFFWYNVLGCPGL